MRRLTVGALIALLVLAVVGPSTGPTRPAARGSGGSVAGGSGPGGSGTGGQGPGGSGTGGSGTGGSGTGGSGTGDQGAAALPRWSPPAPPAAPGPVIPELGTPLAVPTAAAVGKALTGLLGVKALGSQVSAQVVDVQTGGVLLGLNPGRAAVPASTAKILTAAAVLSALGASTTLDTSVLPGPAPGQVVLVGKGDVLLGAGRGDPAAVIGHAGLADLAAATARALQAAGTRSVSVLVDDSLFSGPAASPRWPAADIRGGFVAPVTALAVDAGNASPGRRPRPGEPFARVGDPALSAAQRFAAALGAAGITVTGKVTRGSAAPGAAPLATVSSAPLARVVEEALTDSDNTVGEVLAKLVAVHAGRPATFAGAGQAVLDQVATLGVPVSGQAMSGGSGLGSGYALTPATITQVLALAASDAHPELRAVLTGLPVAGASGTLVDRFGAARNRPAIGTVRAKTGTLTGASSLAGTVVDADGRLLAFAVLADKVSSTLAARSALDDVGAALAACGCS